MAAPVARSPPRRPDRTGSIKMQAETQLMNREIGFLEEELQLIDGLEPVSAFCKEVNDFVEMNPDPLIHQNKKQDKPCCLWVLLRAMLCSWICCSNKCLLQLARPDCRHQQLKNSNCCGCHYGCPCCFYYCCQEVSRCRPSCAHSNVCCPNIFCGCVCTCPKCPEVPPCPRCTKICCVGRCLH